MSNRKNLIASGRVQQISNEKKWSVDISILNTMHTTKYKGEIYIIGCLPGITDRTIDIYELTSEQTTIKPKKLSKIFQGNAIFKLIDDSNERKGRAILVPTETEMETLAVIYSLRAQDKAIKEATGSKTH